MEGPTKKQKKVLLIVGITGAVYASFKYLLPLIIPFLIAYLIALALRPSVTWLERRSRVVIRGRERHLPVGLIGGIELFLILCLAGWGMYYGGKKLCMEAQLLFDSLPNLIGRLDSWLTGSCYYMERFLHVQRGYLVRILRDMLLGLMRAAKDAAMPFLFVNTMTICRWFIQVTVITVILFVATVLSLQEMDSLKERRERSAFCKEFTLLSQRLVLVGNAWLKTQLCIMLMTMILCIIGLTVMGNPYAILVGIGIGLLDALPIFGTGTVLLPWAVFCFMTGSWGKGLILAVLYIVCYFLREILEAKLMGNKMGLSPLETLIAMYVGLQLFGLLGLILGPIGLLIIEDLVACYSR